MTVLEGDALRCTQEMSYPGIGAIQNVFHLENVGVAVSDTQAIADVIEVLEALAVILTLVINALQIVDGVRILNVTPTTPVDVGFGTFSDSTPYTASGQIMPTQVSLGMNLHTARLSVSGRKFWGVPVVGSFLNGGAVIAAALTILTAAAVYMTAPVVATNTTWRFGVVAKSDSTFLSFNAFTLPAMAVIQRRRRATVGI